MSDLRKRMEAVLAPHGHMRSLDAVTRVAQEAMEEMREQCAKLSEDGVDGRPWLGETFLDPSVPISWQVASAIRALPVRSGEGHDDLR